MKRTRTRGFTIVELVVVIAVIGILASLTLLGLSRFQAQTRDSIRSTKATVITEALEKYFDANGEYPSCSQLAQDAQAVTTNTLKGIDSKSLLTPQAASGITNSITCSDLTSVSGPDTFAYVGDGSDACNTGSSCLRFTLKYKDESNNQIDSISSRRNTDIVTSGNITNLSGTAGGFNSINLTWAAVTNAASYKLQRATNSAFTSNVETSVAAVPGAYPMTNTVSGLTQNTTYYFRIAPVSPDTIGVWSNTVSVATWNLTKPVITGTTNSISQITINWSGIAHANSYTLRYSTSSNMSGASAITGITGTSQAVGSLTSATTYYFQLEAIATGWIGQDLSDTITKSTKAETPTGVSAVTQNSTVKRVTWNSVPRAASYDVQYTTDSNFGSWYTVNSGDTIEDVGALSQGQRWYFRIVALSAMNSDASGVANAVTTIDTPAPPGPYLSDPVQPGNANGTGDWTQVRYNWNASYCPAGTSTLFQVRTMNNLPYVGGWSGSTSDTTTVIALEQGVTMWVDVQQRCATGETTSGWSGVGTSNNYRRAVVHFRVRAAALALDGNGYPVTRITANDPGGCAGGLNANIDVKKKRNNADGSSTTNDPGLGPYVTNDYSFSSPMTDYNTYAEFTYVTQCERITENGGSHSITDSGGNTSLQPYYNFGNVRVLRLPEGATYNAGKGDDWNAGTGTKVWGVECNPAWNVPIWCDSSRVQNYSKTNIGTNLYRGNYSNNVVGCGNGNYSEILGVGTGWWRQSC